MPIVNATYTEDTRSCQPSALTTTFTPDPKCRHQFTPIRDILIQEVYNYAHSGYPSVASRSCAHEYLGYPLSFSPGICPSGFTTTAIQSEDNETIAICCSSGYSYISGKLIEATTNGDRMIFPERCISTFDTTETMTLSHDYESTWTITTSESDSARFFVTSSAWPTVLTVVLGGSFGEFNSMLMAPIYITGRSGDFPTTTQSSTASAVRPSPSTPSRTQTETSSSVATPSGLSSSATLGKAVIIIGVFFAALFILFSVGGLLLWRRRRKPEKEVTDVSTEWMKAELDAQEQAKAELEARGRSQAELDTNERLQAELEAHGRSLVHELHACGEHQPQELY